MRKSTYAAATLALALAPLAGTTVTAYAGSGHGACHETKADPNPDRGNDQCHDDSQIPPQGGEATGTPTDVATPPTDVTVKDPLPSTTGTDGSTTYPVEAEVTTPGAGGTGTGEPIGPADAKSWVTVRFVAPYVKGDKSGTEKTGGIAHGYPQVAEGEAPACGPWTEQVDRMWISQSELGILLADGLLTAGEDSTYTKSWTVTVHEGEPCTTPTTPPTDAPTSSEPTPTSTPTSGTGSPDAPPATGTPSEHGTLPPATDSPIFTPAPDAPSSNGSPSSPDSNQSSEPSSEPSSPAPPATPEPTDTPSQTSETSATTSESEPSTSSSPDSAPEQEAPAAYVSATPAPAAQGGDVLPYTGDDSTRVLGLLGVIVAAAGTVLLYVGMRGSKR